LRARERNSLAGFRFLLSLSILDRSSLIGTLSRMPREILWKSGEKITGLTGQSTYKQDSLFLSRPFPSLRSLGAMQRNTCTPIAIVDRTPPMSGSPLAIADTSKSFRSRRFQIEP